MTPNDVRRVRNARIAAEARKAATVYSTSTPVREHLIAVERDSAWGRNWQTMPESEVDAFIRARTGNGVWLSDIDHAAQCWCFKA